MQNKHFFKDWFLEENKLLKTWFAKSLSLLAAPPTAIEELDLYSALRLKEIT